MQLMAIGEVSPEGVQARSKREAADDEGRAAAQAADTDPLNFWRDPEG